MTSGINCLTEIEDEDHLIRALNQIIDKKGKDAYMMVSPVFSIDRP